MLGSWGGMCVRMRQLGVLFVRFTAGRAVNSWACCSCCCEMHRHCRQLSDGTTNMTDSRGEGKAGMSCYLVAGG